MPSFPQDGYPPPFHSREPPLNREPRLSDILAYFITPDGDAAFDRNHCAVPVGLDANKHVVTIIIDPGLSLDPMPLPWNKVDNNTSNTIDGQASSPSSNSNYENVIGNQSTATSPRILTLTVPDLRARFPQHTVTATLSCAGNRRHTMRTQQREVVGVDWGDGAAMNAVWSGPRVRDVLEWAGVRSSKSGKGKGADKGKVNDVGEDEDRAARDWHVAFACHAEPCEDDGWFGSSVPLARLFDGPAGDDSILALDINGNPLSAKRGGPIRAVLPGIIGARWVKWLDTLRLQPRESDCWYMQHDYKVLPSTVTSWTQADEEGAWGVVPPVMGTVVNSVVATVDVVKGQGDRDQDGHPIKIIARGYAVPSADDGPVVAVDVSVDNGHSWHPAVLDDGTTDHHHQLDVNHVSGSKDSSPNDYIQHRNDSVYSKPHTLLHDSACHSNMDKDNPYSWTLWHAELEVPLPASVPKHGSAASQAVSPTSITVLSRASDRGGNVQPRESQWNLRGVMYNGYGEAKVNV